MIGCLRKQLYTVKSLANVPANKSNAAAAQVGAREPVETIEKEFIDNRPAFQLQREVSMMANDSARHDANKGVIASTANKAGRNATAQRLWKGDVENGGSPSVAQRLSEKNARIRLEAEMDQVEAVEILMLIDNIRENIPKIEEALNKYPSFEASFPIRPKKNDEKYFSRKRVRDVLAKKVFALLDNLPTFLDILDGIEDWYIEAEVMARTTEAKKNIADWKEVDKIFNGADATIASLLTSKPSEMRDIADHLANRETIDALRFEIQRWFGSSGGFSALGRANEIETEITKEDIEDIDPFSIDEFFIGGYFQGGKSPESIADNYAIKKEKKEISQKGPVKVMGKKMDRPPEEVADLKDIKGEVESRIVKLGYAGWKKDFRAVPAPMDRKEGQYSNMNKTNARGYAWLSMWDGWNTTAWEWLHVRGASLGGVTDGSNLVLGTKDANTLMMPFESNIRILAGLVKEFSTLDRLSVEWSVEAEDDHAVDIINMKWTLIPTMGADEEVFAIADRASGKIIVPTKDRGTNLSKKEIEFIESQLKEIRQILRDREND